MGGKVETEWSGKTLRRGLGGAGTAMQGEGPARTKATGRSKPAPADQEGNGRR